MLLAVRSFDFATLLIFKFQRRKMYDLWLLSVWWNNSKDLFFFLRLLLVFFVSRGSNLLWWRWRFHFWRFPSLSFVCINNFIFRFYNILIPTSAWFIFIPFLVIIFWAVVGIFRFLLFKWLLLFLIVGITFSFHVLKIYAEFLIIIFQF